VTNISNTTALDSAAEIINRAEYTLDDMETLLSIDDREGMDYLFGKALEETQATVGESIYFRGIIEFSNQCEKNCFYCGIRRDNPNFKRYFLSEDEIMECARWAQENNYGSLVLQSGEDSSEEFVDFVERIVKRITKETGLGITLSVGEQTEEAYRRFFDAGAHRYLLRIETSDPALYARLHPRDHSFEQRIEALRALRKVGYQVGTGVMIGLPHQTIRDIAKDIEFFRKEDFDMFGMGPYIIHQDTPLASPKLIEKWEAEKDDIFNLALRMLAVTRLALGNVNIAATTALQAINPVGRELAFNAGANIVMPIITPKKYRDAYILYKGKPCIEDSAGVCKGCLSKRIDSVGRDIGWGERGDSPHYKERTSVDAL